MSLVSTPVFSPSTFWSAWVLMLSALVLGSSSFWTIWMVLEVLNFIFIPFFLFSESKVSKSKGFIYFTIQSLASIIFIFSCLAGQVSPLAGSLLFLAMLLKLGAFPFHFWSIKIAENLSWTLFFFVFFLMKIAPVLVFLHFGVCPSLTPCLLLGLLMGLGGASASSIRSLLAYSSVSHMSWSILAIFSVEWLSLFYLLSYGIALGGLCAMLNLYNCNSLSDLPLLSKGGGLMVIMVFSIIGLPPFIGFYPKVMVLFTLIKSGMVVESFLALIFTYSTMYMYSKLVVFTFCSFHFKTQSFSFGCLLGKALVSPLASALMVLIFSLLLSLYIII